MLQKLLCKVGFHCFLISSMKRKLYFKDEETLSCALVSQVLRCIYCNKTEINSFKETVENYLLEEGEDGIYKS